MYNFVMSFIWSAQGAVTGVPSVDDEDGDAMGGGSGGRPDEVGRDGNETGGVEDGAALEALEEGGDATPADGGPC